LVGGIRNVSIAKALVGIEIVKTNRQHAPLDFRLGLVIGRMRSILWGRACGKWLSLLCRSGYEDESTALFPV